jgi:hypothetical protein
MPTCALYQERCLAKPAVPPSAEPYQMSVSSARQPEVIVTRSPADAQPTPHARDKIRRPTQTGSTVLFRPGGVSRRSCPEPGPAGKIGAVGRYVRVRECEHPGRLACEGRPLAVSQIVIRTPEENLVLAGSIKKHPTPFQIVVADILRTWIVCGSSPFT